MKRTVPLIVFVLLLASCVGGGFKNTFDDAYSLSQKFQAQCKISATNSTDGKHLTVRLTNVQSEKYLQMPFERFASCVAYEYHRLVGDSAIAFYNGVFIEVAVEKKNGIVTTSTSEQDLVRTTELRRMDSLYRICQEYFNLAYSEQTFITSKQYRDTVYLKDAMVTLMDSATRPFFRNPIVSQIFMGYQMSEDETQEVVWMEVQDDSTVNRYRFVFLEGSEFISGLGIND